MMTNATRKKAIRHIVSALLSGVFSDREVEEVSFALMTDAHFVAELGSVFRRVSQQLSSWPDIPGGVPPEEREPRATTRALRLAQFVKRLGITRRELFNIIGGILPEAIDASTDERLTNVQILSRVLRDLDQAKRVKLLQELRRGRSPNTSNEDPYLDLITKKLDQRDVSR